MQFGMFVTTHVNEIIKADILHKICKFLPELCEIAVKYNLNMPLG